MCVYIYIYIYIHKKIPTSHGLINMHNLKLKALLLRKFKERRQEFLTYPCLGAGNRSGVRKASQKC